MSSNAPGNTFVPKTQQQKVDTFLWDRGMTFLEMLQLHAIFLDDPIGSWELLFFLQDVRENFFRLSALVKIIRASYTLSAEERRGWQACWHRKVRLIQEHLDKVIVLLEKMLREDGWEDSHKSLGAYVLIIAVSIGRLHYEKIDPSDYVWAYEHYLNRRVEDIEREELTGELKEIWVKMTETILCPCEYCLHT